MASRVYCFTPEINKNDDLIKCRICSTIFSLNNTDYYQHFLEHMLSGIISENANKQPSSILSNEIDQWEKDSIKKIQQTANEIRTQLQELAMQQREKTERKIHSIAHQLGKFVETKPLTEKNLYHWEILLEQIKYDLNILSPSIILKLHGNGSFIDRLILSKVNQENLLNEKLESHSEEIQFDDDQHTAIHCGPERNPAYVTGVQEYSSGQHRIRLFISKRTANFILSFNVMSTCMTIPSNSSDPQYITYGWQSNDCINPSQYYLSDEKSTIDLRGNTNFHIELTLDCDRKQISYYNEKTRQTRQLSVDTDKCPLPWKLYFYLYDLGDCVRLLSSFRLS